MVIKTNNKWIGRILGWLLGMKRLRVVFVFEQERWDDHLLESAFYRQTLDLFEEQTDEMKAKLRQAIDDARASEAE